MATKAPAPKAPTTSSYVELLNHTYSLTVEAYASANKRALEYAKSLWEVASKPYSTSVLEAAIADNFDRANQLVSLTVAELEANGQRTAEFAEQIATQFAKFQESSTASLRGLMDSSLENLNYVKDTATAQFEDLSKRFEEMQKSAIASVSAN